MNFLRNIIVFVVMTIFFPVIVILAYIDWRSDKRVSYLHILKAALGLIADNQSEKGLRQRRKMGYKGRS